MLGLLVPGVGMGGGAASAGITGYGRIEYTMPRHELSYTMESERLEFTLAGERLEFTGEVP